MIILPETYIRNALNRFLWWIEGWCYFIDGLCMILSIGFYSPLLATKFSNWRLDKALRDPFSLQPNTLSIDKANRLKARTIAKKLWGWSPKMTITDMSKHMGIHTSVKRSNDNYYSARTVREWIKDICPDRSPGRRPKN